MRIKYDEQNNDDIIAASSTEKTLDKLPEELLFVIASFLLGFKYPCSLPISIP